MLNNFYKRVITGLIFLLVFFGSFFFLPKLFLVLIQGLIPILILVELKSLFKDNFRVPVIFYAFVPFILIGHMYKNIVFRPVVLLLFLTAFTFDSMCYVAGKIFGKRKICPQISPGKTVQGFLGGYISLIILFYLILIFTQKPVSVIFILFFAFICSIIGFAGDIFESWLKRKAGVKDSGNILPGHGGVLDRFDSVMFLAIIFYIFKTQIVSRFF